MRSRRSRGAPRSKRPDAWRQTAPSPARARSNAAASSRDSIVGRHAARATSPRWRAADRAAGRTARAGPTADRHSSIDRDGDWASHGRVGLACRRRRARPGRLRGLRRARPAAAPSARGLGQRRERREETSQLSLVARQQAAQELLGPGRRRADERRPGAFVTRGTPMPARRAGQGRARPAQTRLAIRARSASSSRGSLASHSRTPGPASSAAPATSRAPRFFTMAVKRSAPGRAAGCAARLDPRTAPAASPAGRRMSAPARRPARSAGRTLR